MEVFLKNFGTTLLFRPSGNEAFKIFEPSLADLQETDNLTVDFDGVITFSPSWGDEFLTVLAKRYGNRFFLRNTENPSVQASLRTLEDTNGIKFNVI